MSGTPDAASTTEARRRRTPYGIFLAVMTVFSLVPAAILALNWAFPFVAHAPVQMLRILEVVDLFFVVLFLTDWVYSVVSAESRLRYLFGQRPGRSVPYGVLELFGCVPYSFLFRVLRIFRLRRIGWKWSDLSPGSLYRSVLESRGETAVLVTFIVAFLVIVLGSIAILFVELEDPLSPIESAEDALWWAFVTITTVGYGDTFPVTLEGRVVGVFTMIVGIGIFGVIAGALASVLTSGRDSQARAREQHQLEAITDELAALRAEMVSLREAVELGPPER